MTLFITAYLKNNWKNILFYQLRLIKESKLIENLDAIIVFAYPKDEQLISVFSEFNMLNKTKIVFNEKNEYENKTLQYMLKQHDNYNLYIHTKSASKDVHCLNYKHMFDWMKYMSFFTIYNWKYCIDQFSESDVCAVGVDFKTCPFVHFSGNFWWTTGKHLDRISTFDFANTRYNAEKMIGSIKGKFVSLCQSNIDWYKQSLLEDNWTITKHVYNI